MLLDNIVKWKCVQESRRTFPGEPEESLLCMGWEDKEMAPSTGSAILVEANWTIQIGVFITYCSLIWR